MRNILFLTKCRFYATWDILFGQRQSESIFFSFRGQKIKESTILETTRKLYFCMIFLNVPIKKKWCLNFLLSDLFLEF